MTTQLHTPEAPATSRQRWLLHILTKQDTRNWNLTMQEASDKIGELKSTTKPVNTKHSTSRRHWGIDTFIQTSSSDHGRYGHCSKCLSDMQIFNSDGIIRHYNSHKDAISLGLWGKR